MAALNEAKKAIELRVLAAARKAGVPIPFGEIPGERPDFRFNTGAGLLGIEVSELLRSPRSKGGIAPVAAAAYHQRVVRLAQERYYHDTGVKPARVNLYFADSSGKRRDRRELARVLAEFVKANVHRANPRQFWQA